MQIILSDFMSLDGVVQAPGGGEEDTDGGFAHGGWAFHFFDEEAMGAAIGAVRGLREREGEGLQVMGSSILASQLVEHDLVDEYRLMIEPILLGGGKRLFPDDGQARPLELVSTTTASTGVLICAFWPADR